MWWCDSFTFINNIRPSQRLHSVAFLNSLLPSSSTSYISKETRATLTTAILALEQANPTPNPADSKSLNGVWLLKYSGVSSPSPLTSVISTVINTNLNPASSKPNPGLLLLDILGKLESIGSQILKSTDSSSDSDSNSLLNVGDVEITIQGGENPRVTSLINVQVAGRLKLNLSVVSERSERAFWRTRKLYIYY